jgi:hypothetical protein
MISKMLLPLSHNFVDLQQLNAKPVPCTVDLVGIVKSCEPLREWSRDNKAYKKTAFTLVDETECSMNVR